MFLNKRDSHQKCGWKLIGNWMPSSGGWGIIIQCEKWPQYNLKQNKFAFSFHSSAELIGISFDAYKSNVNVSACHCTQLFSELSQWNGRLRPGRALYS